MVDGVLDKPNSQQQKTNVKSERQNYFFSLTGENKNL